MYDYKIFALNTKVTLYEFTNLEVTRGEGSIVYTVGVRAFAESCPPLVLPPSLCDLT